MKDMAQKGRSCAGLRNNQAKLTDIEVAEIRSLCDSGTRQYKLAEQYGVSDAQISRIVRGLHRRLAKGIIRDKNKHGNYRHGLYSVRRENSDLA